MKKINLQYIDSQWFRPLIVRTALLCLLAILLGPRTATGEGGYPSLRDSIDPGFQDAFEQTLEKQFGEGIRDLIKTKKVGIVLADITDPHRPKVAGVNGDVMLYAASLPKIAIVLGVFVEI